MKFTLKDYQEEAVRDVLDRLKKARRRWHEDGDRHAFSLTAATGAGKTVMAAAVFEALFYGNDDYNFESDPGAVVIWFSDDPSLNVQSMWRLHEASDKLTISDLVTIENTFNRDSLEAGKIYFLNTQKLGKNSLLVRGHDPGGGTTEDDAQLKIMPDLRSFTIWDIIQNTIEDPSLTLYLVLDEAHRGMKESADAKPTIVKQLINGTGSVPGVPVVWGISATVDRFNKAMEGAKGRDTLSNVVVDPKKVQDSGLLKDVIILEIPDEQGDFSTVLVRRGTDKLKELSEAWANYATQQGEVDAVVPLMVLQVQNTPDRNDIGKALNTIFERWSDLRPEHVANVFGEHKTEVFGSYSVPYIEPQRVQESKDVRILIAKDAISTGWDCPRAEVMVSFRAATDRTHITQLLGRMVRAPLARRIPGNERLNSVDCLLPKFDKKSVQEVVASLMTGGDAGDGPPIRRVLINPEEMTPNPDVPEDVWTKLLSLPSQAKGNRESRPVKRLTLLAHELAADGLLPDAGKKAHAELHKVLDGARNEFEAEIERARSAVLTVEGVTVTSALHTNAMTFNDFLEASDYAVIEDAYKRAGRIISPDVATTYSEHLASGADDDDSENALIEAHTVVAALGLVPATAQVLNDRAEKVANEWLTEHKEAIKALTDERQEIYRQVQEMSARPMDVDLARPTVWIQPTTALETDGKKIDLPRFQHHLLCGGDKLFPVDFGSSWEEKVLSTEMQRPGFVAWYRNPGRASQDSLGIVYEEAGESKIVRPDFVFFSKLADGSIAADIVDPHSTHFTDALPKLKGLVKYARNHASTYRRVEAITAEGGIYRMLDLTDLAVQKAIDEAVEGVWQLFASPLARNYPDPAVVAS
ncbi:MAG TPA: DEAD/DEAH box helicase family protein [Vitreimonas sp.]|uniref:DEAD/DEAH box helicase n=1 Tax=Vitreimonas sp. TaxID=3069702 RepID=UPI002D24C80C|nr:DEAD/DEAH box helicase family protein [Vitreimonas sp.]HYD86247.1 DEAD/DEAH box helicase family protein [Vitreimonas sp.]